MCHFAPWQAYLKGTRRTYVAKYSHMSSNQYTTIKCTEPTWSLWYSRKDPNGILIEVKVWLPSNKAMKMMEYTVHDIRTRRCMGTSA